MRIDIVSCVPDLLAGAFEESIMKRARDKGYLDLHIHNLHDYAYDRYRRTDDYPFGGGAGMVMMAEPIDRCLSALKAERHYDEVIYMTPDGVQYLNEFTEAWQNASDTVNRILHDKEG